MKALLTEFAAVLVHPLNNWWQRFKDSMLDPIRRRHVFFEIVMVWTSSYVWTFSWWKAIGIVGTYYGIYEFLVEPLARWMVGKGFKSIAGPYWERGPRDGEVFDRE